MLLPRCLCSLFLVAWLTSSAHAWRIDLGSSGLMDYVEDMTLDPLGNPIVVARLNAVMTVVKMDRNTGAPLWSRGFPDSPYSTYYPPWVMPWEVSGIQTDASGRVFAVGWSNPDDYYLLPWESSCLVMALNGADGTLLWTRDLGRGYGMSLALDGAGGVIIGSGWNPIPSGPPQAAAVIKLDASSGTTLWESTEILHAMSLTVDAAGDVVAVGGSLGAGPDLVLKLDGATGLLLWSQFHDRARIVAIDSLGDVIAGDYAPDGGFGCQISKYAGATGAVQWSHVEPYLWAVTALAVSTNGGVVAVGEWYNGYGYSDGMALKLDGATGVKAWTTGNMDTVPLSVALDSNNDVYLAGFMHLGYNPAAKKLSGATGAQKWHQEIIGTSYFPPETNFNLEWSSRVLADATGHVFVGGTVYNKYPSYPSPDAFVIRLNATLHSSFYGELNPIWESWLGWVFGYRNPDRVHEIIEDGLRSDPVLEDAIWTELAEDLLELPNRPVILTPVAEVTALLWIADHQEVLHEVRTAQMYLFLEQDGAGARLLQKLIDKGIWDDPEPQGARP